MSLGEAAKIFLGKNDKIGSIQKTEIQPVVLHPRPLEFHTKTPDEIRQLRNLQARLAAEKKAA